MIDALYRTFVPLGLLTVMPFLDRRHRRWRAGIVWPRPRRRNDRPDS